MKRTLAFCLMFLLILTGCNATNSNEMNNDTSYAVDEDVQAWTVESYLEKDTFALSDSDYDTIESFLNEINTLEKNYSEAVEEKIEALYADLDDYIATIEEADKGDSSDDSDMDLEPWTLESFLGDAVEEFLDSDLLVIEDYLIQINEIEGNYTDDLEEKLDDLYDDLYEFIDQVGVALTFEEDGDYGDDDYELQPWTADLYLGADYDKLSTSQIDDVTAILDQINDEESKSQNEVNDKINTLYQDLNDLLRSFGLVAPIDSYQSLIEEYPQAFTDGQAREILALDQRINELSETDPDSSEIDEAYEALEALLEDAGFDSENIIGQIESGSISYATFTLAGKLMTFTESQDISSEDMIRYDFLIDQTKKVIAKDMLHYIKYFVINTDGYGNVLAYVSQENEALTKWRVVLDFKDAYDESGNYLEEYDETLVHEYAHILTLNASQMQSSSSGTYENEEGILTEGSYLNRFYNMFWLDIIDEHKEIVYMDESGDAAYEFYEKYSDQFVSDYAATNPEEDFAETFRIFVFEDEPSGDAIKDEKIKFFYDDTKLNGMRLSIRKNLGLN